MTNHSSEDNNDLWSEDILLDNTDDNTGGDEVNTRSMNIFKFDLVDVWLPFNQHCSDEAIGLAKYINNHKIYISLLLVGKILTTEKFIVMTC